MMHSDIPFGTRSVGMTIAQHTQTLSDMLLPEHLKLEITEIGYN
jgi:hypothetical protein